MAVAFKKFLLPWVEQPYGLACSALLFCCLITALISASVQPGHRPVDGTSSKTPRRLPYLARWCKLTKDTALLRLYDPKEETLLAERMFFELDAPIFWWTVDELGYDIQRKYVIKLPPTWIDRLRAQLP